MPPICPGVLFRGHNSNRAGRAEVPTGRPPHRWRTGACSATVPFGGTRAHETNHHLAGAPLCGPVGRSRASRSDRWQDASLAFQFARNRAAVSARRARRVRLGVKRVLDAMRIILRLGNGGLPERGFAGALPETDGQMRPLLPARMPHQRRALFADRISLGVAARATKSFCGTPDPRATVLPALRGRPPRAPAQRHDRPAPAPDRDCARR
jgi:hypothetical protein